MTTKISPVLRSYKFLQHVFNCNSVYKSISISSIISLPGVAFEQGKMLPTPETVPFRLTRDMVDAMGISAVEGAFRRCCDFTMGVMRTSQEALHTIVQVRFHIKILSIFLERSYLLFVVSDLVSLS